MTKVIFALMLGFLLGIASAAQPEKVVPLFGPADAKDLTEGQKKIYDRILAAKTTKAVAVHQLNNLYGVAEFAKKVDLKFKVKDIEVEILGCTVNKGKVTLEKEGRNFVILTVKDASVTGLVYSGKHVFSVTPLGDFKVAITHLNQMEFPKD